MTVSRISLPGVIYAHHELDCWQKSCRLANGSTAEVMTEADCCAIVAAAACEK